MNGTRKRVRGGVSRLFILGVAALALGALGTGAVGLANNFANPLEVRADNPQAQVSIAERAETLGWANATAYTGWTDTSGMFTFVANGGGNNGKYYTSDNSWRLYNGGSAQILIHEDYDIVSIASTPSQTFTVSGDKKSASISFTATVKFTAFTITYKAATSTYTVTYAGDGNTGGSVPVDGNEYNKNDEVTVLGNTGNLTKNEYVFAGWTDGVTNYAAGDKFTITGNTTLTAIWDEDPVASLAVSGTLSKTTYPLNGEWDPSGLVVTATLESGAELDVSDSTDCDYLFYNSSDELVENPAALGLCEGATLKVIAIYKGVSSIVKYVASTDIDVISVSLYDLTKIDGFSSWTNAYGAHNVASTDIDENLPAASMAFLITNKQGSGVGSEYPCIGSKTSEEVTCLTFTLNELGKKITSVSITFVTRYTSTFPSLYLHKGNGIGTDAVADLTMSGSAGNELKLEYDNINDTVFTVGYNAHQTGSNGAVGIKSITIGLVEQQAYGDTDHIKISSMPNTSVYHVGEVYDATGLTITAYDGAEEATANFMDITGSASTVISKTSGYVFTEEDVPSVEVTVTYTENETPFEVTFTLAVYALAEYRLVTEAPADWSGNYLIVGVVDDHYYAMNGALPNPDVEFGFKAVDSVDGVITTGQELEWTIGAYDSGYSVQGKSNKYIGSLTSKSNGMLVNDSPLKNVLSYGEGATTITGTNTYNLAFNNTADHQRFRYYSSGTVQLYKLVESSDADDYALAFLGALSCDATGTYKPEFNLKQGETYWSWELLETEYNGLSNADKELFRLGVASETGTNIQQALARYDFIVGKYYKTGLDTSFVDFMDRDPAPVSQSGVQIEAQHSIVDSGAIWAIVAIFGALSVAGVCFISSKRKRQR